MPAASTTNIISACANVATVLTLVAAVVIYHCEQRSKKRDDVYRRIGSEWSQFLHVAIEHPELDPVNFELAFGRAGSSEENERTVLFSLVATMFGRAWEAYNDQPERVRETRWAGWERDLARWTQRAEFREFWARYGSMYDADFVAYMRERFGLALATPESA